MTLDSILEFAHAVVAGVLSPGAVALDATVGNGHDTLFLAQHVGETGRVYGFDVQQRAIARTRERLDEAGVADRVTLTQTGHETMDDVLPPDVRGRIAAITFNLGYLPGSDKTCITRPETTVRALEHSVQYLKPGGILTVVLYIGHDGGAVEAQAVDTWAQSLAPDAFQVLSYRFMNRCNDPPRLLAIERLSDNRI